MSTIRTILHPTDFSPQSDAALRHACSLATDYRAHVILLHVIQPTLVLHEGAVIPDLESGQAALREKLDHLPVANSVGTVERRLEEGDPAGEIVEVARECHADLIVMGTHGRGGIGRLIMGSVAEKVMRTAPCPVMTVMLPPALKADKSQLQEQLA